MNETRSPGTLWSRLCRSVCREQGAKDAVVVALMAIVLGALALQLGLDPIGPRPARRDGQAHASLYARDPATRATPVAPAPRRGLLPA